MTKMVDSKRTMAWHETFDFVAAGGQSTLYLRMLEYGVNKCVWFYVLDPCARQLCIGMDEFRSCGVCHVVC